MALVSKPSSWANAEDALVREAVTKQIHARVFILILKLVAILAGDELAGLKPIETSLSSHIS